MKSNENDQVRVSTNLTDTEGQAQNNRALQGPNNGELNAKIF